MSYWILPPISGTESREFGPFSAAVKGSPSSKKLLRLRQRFLLVIDDDGSGVDDVGDNDDKCDSDGFIEDDMMRLVIMTMFVWRLNVFF